MIRVGKERQSDEKTPTENLSIDETDPRTVVLQAMYSEPKTSVGWIPAEGWEEYMAEKTGLNKMSIRNARIQLEQVGLIQENEWISPEYVLTREGYKIAHEQEIMRRQLENDRKQTSRMEEVNNQYNTLTFLLVVVGALEVLAATIRASFKGVTALGFYTLIFLVTATAYLVIISGSLEQYLENKNWFFN